MTTDGASTLDEIADTIRATEEYETKYFKLDELDRSEYEWTSGNGRPLESLGSMLEKAEAGTEVENYDEQFEIILATINQIYASIRETCKIPRDLCKQIVMTFNEIHIKPFAHYKPEPETEPQEKDTE